MKKDPFEIKGGVLISFSGSEDDVVTIPANVKKIGKRAFFSDTNPYKGEIRFAGPTKEIEDEAFLGCLAKSVDLPEGLESIGNYAFSGCKSLAGVKPPKSLKAIGNMAFHGCSSLSAVTIPGSVKTISPHAFDRCRSLEEVEIEEGVEEIGDFAFRKTFLTEIRFPASMKHISPLAFDDCTYLSEFVVDLESETYTAIKGDLYTHDKRTLVRCIDFDATGFAVPRSVYKIGEYAFKDCMNLASLGMSGAVTEIGAHAFENCKSLASFRVPSGVKTIGEGAFTGCAALKTVAIPASVKTIGANVFSGCYNLDKVIMEDPEGWIYEKKPGVEAEAKSKILADPDRCCLFLAASDGKGKAGIIKRG